MHTVFFDLIQNALDDFREMWNHHIIRGPRTQRGFGGGIPVELFCDEVESTSLNSRDDERFYPDPSSYGVAEPHKGDTAELDFSEVKLIDPLYGWPSLQHLRNAFFKHFPFSSLDGIDDYLIFKLVSHELLLYADHAEFGGNWQSFMTQKSPYSQSRMWALRSRLAAVALQL